MRRAAILAAVLLVCAGVVYGMYYVSPYGQHNRQAAAYEHTLRGRVLSVGAVQVVSGRHRVSGNRWGTGGQCSLLATLEVSTSLDRRAFEERLKAVLQPYPDEYLSQQIRQLPDRDGWRIFRLETGTLVDGGTLDLRCG